MKTGAAVSQNEDKKKGWESIGEGDLPKVAVRGQALRWGGESLNSGNLVGGKTGARDEKMVVTYPK